MATFEQFRDFEPMALTDHETPVDKVKIVRYLEYAMMLRFAWAEDGAAKGATDTAGIYLAMCDLYYAVLERIGMGKFDVVAAPPAAETEE